eukprot:9997231-Alexandrium_andersonii.AAC.1
MSASLVGSEMCIRDSCCFRGRRSLSPMGESVWVCCLVSQHRVKHGVSAVSYTHLTLPTICSV